MTTTTLTPLAVVQAAYQAFRSGDMEAFGALLAPDTVWRLNDVGPLNGTYQGPDGVFRFLGGLMERSGGTFSLTVDSLMGNDSHATAVVSESAQREGRTLAGQVVHVFRIVDGQIAEFWGCTPDGTSNAFWDEPA